MPKFLVEARYLPEGFKGLAKETPSGRKAVVAQVAKNLGGKLDAMFFSLGENDAIMIFDMPDAVSAAALSCAACASGVVRTKTSILLTAAEADDAFAKPVNYRAPGARVDSPSRLRLTEV